MARQFVELAFLRGVAGVDTKKVAEGKRCRFTVAIHPDPKQTRWVTCFGPCFPEALAVKTGDRLEVKGFWSGNDEVNVFDVNIVETKAAIEAKRAEAKAKRAEGTKPAAEWHDSAPNEQLHMEEPQGEQELPL